MFKTLQSDGKATNTVFLTDAACMKLMWDILWAAVGQWSNAASCSFVDTNIFHKGKCKLLYMLAYKPVMKTGHERLP